MKRVLIAAALLLSLPVAAASSSIIAQGETYWCKLTWVNSDVTALAGTSGNVPVCTLPAAARVMNAAVRVTGAAVGPTTVTVSVGRTASTFADYVLAANGKATGVYGDALAELGTGLQSIVGDIPSLAATTAVNLQFVSTVANLSTVTGSAGTVWIRFEIIP